MSRRPAEGASGGARPGDIAREALRAARDEARRPRTRAGAEDTEVPDAGAEWATGAVSAGGKAVEAGRRSAEPTGSGARPSQDQGPRVRDVRDLLAGAFELPADVAPSDASSTGRPGRTEGEARGRRSALGGAPHEAASDAPPVRLGDAAQEVLGTGSTHPGITREDSLDTRPARSKEPEASTSGTRVGQPGEEDEASLGRRSVRPGAGEGVSGTRFGRPGEEDEASLGRRSVRPGGVGEVILGARFARAGEDDEASFGPRPARAGSPSDANPGGQPSSYPGSEQRAVPPPYPGPDRRSALSASSGPERASGPVGRRPRSMGSPGRDGELRRTFPAFPARVSGADSFAETWWGNAWVSALEEGALDAARLARGRVYAGHGHVDAITVTPGLVLAYVHGSRPRPYRVQVSVRTRSDSDWDRFLDAAAERPGHIAALLDKEMPKSLAECGVPLLPGPGELEPHCSCPDSGHPCKHAAALCYQTARLLDEDPFVLLLLRGRGERELLDELSRRNAARAARAAQEQEPAPLPGVRARDALARRTLPPLPAPLPPPAHPEQPPTYPGAPGGPDPFALDQLATDAAARAHALLTTGRDPVAELTLWQDAVRIAAARPGSGLTAATRALYSSLASATGRTPADLARAVAAWRQGGFEGLRVLEEPWDPPAGRFDRARPLLLAADLPAFRPWRNHLTHPRGHAQLRLGHNGLWYAYESEPGRDDWWPRGTPDLDPVGALTGLGTPDDT
ncbi:SWIM zinc finger family protein [Streptomyces sp. NPDC048415]|uniref:SWIM zinc finger family protein n=1 Tax=Streptomyces sp. NPDC048415 TaxID=3154822 RepID=UPI00343831FE